MIYSSRSNVLFTHISRTGGTSLTNFLRKRPSYKAILQQHSSLTEAREILGNDFDTTFKFSMVRNPWDRLLSWYSLIIQHTHAIEMSREAFSNPDAKHWKGFDNFLEQWSSKKIIIDGVSRHELSQFAQLSNANNELLTNDIGRFETFEADISRIFLTIGIQNYSIPKLNSSTRQHYNIYYSDFGRDLVADIFQKDIEVFAYKYLDKINDTL